jgi:hypothetical protein
MLNITRRNKISIFIIVVVLGYVLLGIGVRFGRAYRFQGEWKGFDSQDYFQTETFPDGLRLDYPKGWELSVYEKGGTKNLGELRVSFIKSNYFFWPDTGLNVWWRRIDENWALEDAREWYVENLAFGISDNELEQKQDTFQEITVGTGNYPALTQTFHLPGRNNPRKQVVLLVVGDEAFAFTFQMKGDDEEIRKIVERMLNSLEIYE